MVATRISSNLAPQAGSTKMCQTARVYLRLSKYPKLSIPIVVEFKFRLSFEKLEVGSLGVLAKPYYSLNTFGLLHSVNVLVILLNFFRVCFIQGFMFIWQSRVPPEVFQLYI